MVLKKKTRLRFIRYLGKHFRDDRTTLHIYSRDMAELPPLTKIMFQSTPDAVILPRTIEDVQRIYQLANETSVPITLRSGGTAGFGGAITYKKGIVVDGKGIESEIFVEPLEQSVTSSPSMIFSDMQRILNLQGFSLCAYPSSYNSATIGGWISHGGYGVGSSQYGGALDQILELDVVLPNGEVKKYTEKEDISLFVGSNGTLGMITNIKLKIKFDIPLKQWGCTFDSPIELMKGLEEIAKLKPFSVWFFDPAHVMQFNDSFGFALPYRYVAIVSKEISYEEEEIKFHSSFNQAIRKAGGQILDKRYISNIWEYRFKTFSMLKNYEDFLVSEVILPFETSAKYVQKLKARFNKDIHLEGEMISDSHYSLLLFMPLPEKVSSLKRTILYIRLMGATLKGLKYGGYPYSTGMWFASYYHKIYGKEQLKRYKEFKKTVDVNNIANPGKVISPRLRVFPIMSMKTAIKLVSRLL